MTSIVPRRTAPVPASAGSSSDPPTRFLRGIDEHIELPAGSIVDDHYEIEAKLGAGAMGVVYSARHLKLGRRVAIKVIAPSMGADQQALARFEREARALASMNHPNIVEVYGLGTLPDDRSYMVMEHLVGETLYERLEHGRVPFDEALDVLDQMSGALDAAHAAGIVHRDLKPENTFLQRRLGDRHAAVKLLDFGLVRLAVSDGVESTASGAVIGTCLYISPEQARSPSVDGRTDIYALGVVAYELILGQHPFPHARTATAALAAHLAEAPPLPSTIWREIPAALDLLLYSMIAKDANYRPTLAQVQSVITSVRSGTASEHHVSRAATVPVGRSAIRRRVWMGALLTLALVIGIAIGSRGRGGPSDDDKPRSLPSVSAGSTPALTPSVPVTTDARVDFVDAHAIPAEADALASDTTEPARPSTRPKKRDARNANQKPTTIDVGASMEPTRQGSNEVNVAPPVSPVPPSATSPIEMQPQPLPAQSKPGRNDTINPFAKKGSAAR